eukprot:scaffold11353_cov62-Phaeocystis_antarctica.AAC.1
MHKRKSRAPSACPRRSLRRKRREAENEQTPHNVLPYATPQNNHQIAHFQRHSIATCYIRTCARRLARARRQLRNLDGLGLRRDAALGGLRRRGRRSVDGGHLEGEGGVAAALSRAEAQLAAQRADEAVGEVEADAQSLLGVGEAERGLQPQPRLLNGQRLLRRRPPKLGRRGAVALGRVEWADAGAVPLEDGRGAAIRQPAPRVVHLEAYARLGRAAHLALRVGGVRDAQRDGAAGGGGLGGVGEEVRERAVEHARVELDDRRPRGEVEGDRDALLAQLRRAAAHGAADREQPQVGWDRRHHGALLEAHDVARVGDEVGHLDELLHRAVEQRPCAVDPPLIRLRQPRQQLEHARVDRAEALLRDVARRLDQVQRARDEGVEHLERALCLLE